MICWLLILFSLVATGGFSRAPTPRAIDLSFQDGMARLETSVLSFKYYKPRKTSEATSRESAVVDLYSMLHVGERAYFRQLEERMRGYDIVLYELITDESNTEYESRAPHRRVLTTDLVAPEAEKLASELDFTTQMCMNFQAPNWYIADLDSTTVGTPEQERRGTTMTKYITSLIAGRASKQRLTVKNFYLADTPFVTALRLTSWLTPCPELGLLALDWSRFAKAGGLPAVVGPIIESLLAGDIQGARKLAFTQQMLSGLPDSGAWGGEAMSDTTVRVKARNRKCLETLQSFLKELPDVNEAECEPKRIAILYGAYHIASLSTSMVDMGLLKTNKSPESTKGPLVAWTMNAPNRVSQGKMAPGSGIGKDPAEVVSYAGSLLTGGSPRQALAVLLVVPLYLAVGAFDWWALVKLTTDAVQAGVTWGFGGASTDISALASSVGCGVVYFIFYVQRHLSILRSFSQYGVQWERTLFEDVLVNEPEPF